MDGKEHVSMSLPSLRIDNFSQSLVEKTSRVRKSGLTFAPEAGTQRLRDVINKNVTMEEIEKTCNLAFDAGYTSVKLYFMMGLPTETLEDIEGIAQTAQRVVELFYQNPNRPKGKSVQVSISVACFVPKPHTPFEFVPQDTQEALQKKQQHLLHQCKKQKDQRQLPRQPHQFSGGGVRKRGQTAWRRAAGGVPPRLLFRQLGRAFPF